MCRDDASASFDFVEEPLDQVALSVETRVEADRVLSIALRRDDSPGTLLVRERSKPVRVIAAIGQ